TRARTESQRRAQAEEIASQLREERDVYESLAHEYEDEIARLRAELEQQPTVEREAAQTAQLERMQSASDLVELDEEDTRHHIDAQLRQHGWQADSAALRWGQGARPEPGVARAIAEVPTGSGPADYVLFDGLTPLAVVEAKRWEQDVAGSLDQARRYARDYDISDEQESPGGPWTGAADDYLIPFAFATNGRTFLHQIERRSGIWFDDLRRPQNIERPLAGWYTPDGLRNLLDKDVDAALEMLREEPMGYLSLRDYQQEAVQSIEAAVGKGRRKALLAMATGTGKTRTALGLIFRLVKSGLARRVLFLVDRTSLGRQAFETFQTVKLESQNAFTEIYDTKPLDDSRVEKETRLSFATVQSMVHRVLDLGEHEQPPPVDQFDFIVVDECHRGYNLDQEMDEVEMQFRDFEDYVSKYRRVLDYFDATRIGLTATPAKHTTEIFHEPVYTYRYKRAVMEGNLVDQDPPISLATHLSKHGIHYEPGEQLQLMDTRTGEIDFANTPDEMSFDVSQFNQAIQVPGFNEAICQELADRIDIKKPGKTLVFCVSENHAQDVAHALRKAYQEQGVDDLSNRIKVITGYTDDTEQWLRRYKNEKKPAIAITVDYLTTGVDVPEIVNLVFLRRVKSRILYEQMKGRATRLCPKIHKDAYRIFDCVDIYSALEDVTDMRPVVTRPNLTFEQLYDEVTTLEDREHLSRAQRDLVGKLQRKFKRLSDEGRAEFERMMGMEPEEFVANVRDREPEEAGAWLEGKEPVVQRISELAIETKDVIYDPRDDMVVEVTQVERDEPGYLEQFEEWVTAHLDSYEALQMVTQRPRELTRQALRDLEQELSKQGYSTKGLRNA
ncbi:MAG: type I restriction-modification system endonuclease, partial [Myxococcota bacterium]